MKKILITGSSGYIGQHLVRLLGNNYDVYGVDWQPRFNDYLKYNHFYQHDITEYFSSQIRHESWDSVVHLAALVRVNESVDQPTRYYKNNVLGTINCVENLQYNNFIFASTGAAENPITPYSLSKRIGEDIVGESCDNYTIFRFYNVIGSEGVAPTNPDGLFARLILAESTGVFNLYGGDYSTPDGTALRDYVHVMDICRSIKRAIAEPSNSLENLGTGQGYSVKEIADQYQLSNDCSFDIRMCERRAGDLERSVLSSVSRYMSNSYSLQDLLKKN